MKITTDLEEQNRNALQAIAEIKRKKGFECRNCLCTEYYEIGDTFSRKCKQCKRTESVTANTVFTNQKIPIAIAITLIEALRENILLTKEEIKKEIDIYSKWQMEARYEFGKHVDDVHIPGFEKNITKLKNRFIISSAKLGKLYGLRQKTVSTFIRKLVDSVPKEYDEILNVGSRGLDADGVEEYGRFANFLASHEMERILEYYVTLDPDIILSRW